jgi:hypothetical protein
MSDRFDITFDHKVDTKPDGGDAGEGARILFESLVPGAMA